MRGILIAVLVLAACSKPTRPLLPWQVDVSTLPRVEQRVFERLRAGEREGFAWRTLEHGIYVNDIGVPADPSRLRWLVLTVKPEPGLLRQAHEPVAKDDAEHRVSSDGGVLHVTWWQQPNQGELPTVTTPIPAEDGWTQVVTSR